MKKKSGRTRVNSADADVINKIEKVDKRGRSESSDFIKVTNNFTVDEKMPSFVPSSSFTTKKTEEIEVKKVKPVERKFKFLNRIEECPEEMEDNEAAVAPAPRKRRRKTRSSRWVTVAGSKTPDSDNKRTLELLKQFQQNKIQVDTGVIIEEEEEIEDINSQEEKNKKVDSDVSGFFSRDMSPFASRKTALGYLNLPKRKEIIHKKSSSFIDPRFLKKEKIVENSLKDTSLRFSELKINDEPQNRNETTPESHTTLNTASLIENSTIKKNTKIGDGFKLLNDSSETQKKRGDDEEKIMNVNRKLFKTKSHEIKFEKLEKDNDPILTKFEFDISKVKESSSKIPKSSREKTNSIFTEFELKGKNQIEKSKNLTRSSPKIGKILLKNKEKNENSDSKKRIIYKAKKIKLRLQDLKINPTKLQTPKLNR